MRLLRLMLMLFALSYVAACEPEGDDDDSAVDDDDSADDDDSSS